jgi:NhaP-type Na+/H+ or K+/H+ antiporter
MRKKKFFSNLGNVAIFGLGVTLVCFILYSAAGIAIIKMGPMMSNYYDLNHDFVDPTEENPQEINITIMQMLLFTALLCSSDVVAAVSIVDYTKQPKLYSCIFGEGVVNDIVSIILFNTVLQLQSVTFQWYTPLIILGQFLMLGIVSLLVGLFFGFLTSYIFKHCNFLRVNAITETFLVFSFSIASYFVSDSIKIAGIQMSGIISLLVCGIV